MSIGGGGLAAPDTRLKLTPLQRAERRFIDVSRNRLGPAKDHDDQSTGDIGQPSRGRQAGHVGAVWALE
jgi:hypothetical protein